MARTTSSVKHTHQYYRASVTGLWHCSGKDGCTHYMPKNMPIPAGRMSICWGMHCGKEFLLTPYNMQKDKPVCDTCEEQLDTIDSWLEEKLKKPVLEPKFKTRAPVVVTKQEVVEEDQIEVIEADEMHASDCAIYDGMECTCK